MHRQERGARLRRTCASMYSTVCVSPSEKLRGFVWHVAVATGFEVRQVLGKSSGKPRVSASESVSIVVISVA